MSLLSPDSAKAERWFRDSHQATYPRQALPTPKALSITSSTTILSYMITPLFRVDSDSCIQSGFFGFNVMALAATIWDDGDFHFTATTRATIGRSVASVLRHSDATANRSVCISSFEVSMNEMLSAHKKAIGEK